MSSKSADSPCQTTKPISSAQSSVQPKPSIVETGLIIFITSWSSWNLWKSLYPASPHEEMKKHVIYMFILAIIGGILNHSYNNTGRLKVYFRSTADGGIIYGTSFVPVITATILAYTLRYKDYEVEIIDYWKEMFIMSCLIAGVLTLSILVFKLSEGRRWVDAGVKFTWTLLMCGALKQKADGKDEANRYLAGFLAPVVFIQLIRTFSLNFSFAESSVITQAFILLFFNTIHQTLGLAFPNQTGNFVTTNPNYIFHQALIIGMILVGVITLPILSKIRDTSVHHQTMVMKEATIKNEVRPLLLILAAWKRWVNDKTWMGTSLVFYLGFIAFVFGVLTPWVHAFLGENPWIWLINYIVHPIRFAIIFYLIVLLLVSYIIFPVSLNVTSFPVPGSVKDEKKDQQSTVISKQARLLNLRRKFFHGLALGVLVPPFFADSGFTHLAFSVALSLFIFTEYLRYFLIPPFGYQLHQSLSKFLDERDTGPAIISHIYLLLGCAVPLWLASFLDDGGINNSNGNEKKGMMVVLPAIAGAVTLGIGDAMASIIGQRYGRIRYPNSKKTVEGTIGFILGSLLFIYTILFTLSFMASMGFASKTKVAVLWNEVWGEKFHAVVFSVALTGLLESVSHQFDNLFIPVFMFICLLNGFM